MAVVAGGVSIMIAASGRVYTCGWGDYGQLGHGDTEDQSTPKLVGALAGEQVVDVCAGGSHTIAVTADGRAFSWGYGHGGQLGHGEPAEHQHTPKQITALAGHRIVRADAGASHTIMVSASGTVFSCGRNRYGHLGHGAKRELLCGTSCARYSA